MKKFTLFMLLSIFTFSACNKDLTDATLPTPEDETQSVELLKPDQGSEDTPNFTKGETPRGFTNAEKASISQAILESPDFIALRSKLDSLAQKLVPEDVESREIALWNDENELFDWVDKNIHKTGFSNTAAFAASFQEVKNLSASLRIEYADFLEAEDNRNYFKGFILDKEPGGGEIAPQSTICLTNLTRCTVAAKEVYDQRAATAIVLALVSPVTAVAYLIYAQADYKQTVDGCFKTYNNCNIK